MGLQRAKAPAGNAPIRPKGGGEYSTSSPESRSGPISREGTVCLLKMGGEKVEIFYHPVGTRSTNQEDEVRNYDHGGRIRRRRVGDHLPNTPNGHGRPKSGLQVGQTGLCDCLAYGRTNSSHVPCSERPGPPDYFREGRTKNRSVLVEKDEEENASACHEDAEAVVEKKYRSEESPKADIIQPRSMCLHDSRSAPHPVRERHGDARKERRTREDQNPCRRILREQHDRGSGKAPECGHRREDRETRVSHATQESIFCHGSQGHRRSHTGILGNE